MKKSALFIGLFFILITPLYSLPIKTTVRPVSSCPGEYVVGIQVENCYWIGAISLKLDYDAAHVTYLGYLHLHDSLMSGMTVINGSNGMVTFSWASLYTANVGTDTLVEFRFSSGPGTFPFNWSTSVQGNCEYADTLGNILPSSYVNGTATVFQGPVITQHPVNKVAYFGNNTSFSIGATGTGLAFQWQVSTNSGSAWNNLSNVSPYSGVNGSSLSITSLTLALSGNRYRCLVSGSCPTPQTSNSALLLVYNVINTSVPTVSPCAGNVVVPVTAQYCNGVGAISLKLNYYTGLLTYQGFQNVNPVFANGIYYFNETGGEVTFSWASLDPVSIGTGTLFELVFTSLPGNAYLNWSTGIAGNCEYSDSYGNMIASTYSNGGVNTQYPPAITTNPVNRSVLAGQNTSFSVSATGAGLSYQWQLSTNGGGTWGNLVSGTPYSGVNSSTLSITAATQGLNGYKYRCIVSGTCPSPVTSGAATLTVTTPPTPVTTTAGSVSNSCSGNITVPVNVTNCSNVGAISLVLQYDTTKLFYNGYSSVNPAITTGFFLVNRAGSRITLSCATMTAINITSGTLVNYHFIARTNGTSTLTWDTQNAGNCEYSDISGIVLYATYNNGSVSFLSNVLLVNAGPDLTVPSGGSVTFTAGTSGGVTPLTYNWTPSTGLNNASLLNPVASPTVTTTYRLTVTGSNGCSTWDEMTVTVLPPVVPENLMVETTTVTDGMTVCFNATQTVTLAGDGKLFTVANGGHADVIAGQRIWLKPGTRVEMGGHFAAWITSSGTYCNTSPGMKTVINDEFTEITGTSGVRDHSRLILWPVPADEKIYIDLSEEIFASTVKIRIISLTGKILTDQLFSDLKKLTIDVSDMKAGVYILSVGHLHGTEIRKIVVR